MCYIWINPVTDQMYDRHSLDLLLQRHGYERVECRQDWVSRVKKEYERAVEESEYPVADVRCPAVSQLLKRKYEKSSVQIPDIEPILIHCAREISGREDLKSREKLITTPCRILADMGNEIGLPGTHFLSWKEFLKKIGEKPETKKLDVSPIPPGFFDCFSNKVVSITGEDRVKRYLEKEDYGDARIVELLWCRDGCHRGDGVIDLE